MHYAAQSGKAEGDYCPHHQHYHSPHHRHHGYLHDDRQLFHLLEVRELHTAVQVEKRLVGGSSRAAAALVKAASSEDDLG